MIHYCGAEPRRHTRTDTYRCWDSCEIICNHVKTHTRIYILIYYSPVWKVSSSKLSSSSSLCMVQPTTKSVIMGSDLREDMGMKSGSFLTGTKITQSQIFLLTLLRLLSVVPSLCLSAFKSFHSCLFSPFFSGSTLWLTATARFSSTEGLRLLWAGVDLAVVTANHTSGHSLQNKANLKVFRSALFSSRGNFDM